MENPIFKINQDGWLEGCRHVCSPNSDDRPGGIAPDLLVIHNISLPPEQFGGSYIDQLFTNSLDSAEHPYFLKIADMRVSSHLLIDRTGALTQFVSLGNRAWHAGESSWQGRANCNDYSIGIELEGSDTQPFTDEQYAVLTRVTLLIQDVFPSITPDRILGHSDIAPIRKTDPGPYFDWEKYKIKLED
jgi:N-acetyl-anhydromuramoyl-L-alanine amidase